MSKEKKQVTKNDLKLELGLFLVLISFVLLAAPFSFMNHFSEPLFYVFGIVGYWFFLPFLIIVGIVLIIETSTRTFDKSLFFIGLSLSLIGLNILFSSLSLKDGLIKIEHVHDSIENIFFKLNREGALFPLSMELGGGLFGFLLLSLFNFFNNKIIIIIFSSLIILLGLFLCLIKQILYVVQTSKNQAPIKRSKKEIKNIVSFETVNENRARPIEINDVDVTKDSLSGYDNLLSNMNVFNSSEGFTIPSFDFAETSENKITETLNNEQKTKKDPINSDITADNESDIDSLFGSKLLLKNNSSEENLLKKCELQDEEIQNQQEETQAKSFLKNNSVCYEEEDDYSDVEIPLAEPPMNYIAPSLDLLDYHEKVSDKQQNEEWCLRTLNALNEIFNDLHIGAKAISYTTGPSVTRFDIQMNQDSSNSTISKYVDDISSRLEGVPVRFEKIVIGKTTSGIEIPNSIRTPVGLKECLEEMNNMNLGKFYIPFGKNISNSLVTDNFRGFPHMLVAGSTGSGKSVFIQSILATLIMRNSPEELKLVLIDPKVSDMNFFKKIPHLLCPVVNTCEKAQLVLDKIYDEMEKRNRLFAKVGVTNAERYNEIAKKKGYKTLPIIFIVIDEFADLVENCKDITTSVVKLAQKARSSGCNILLATQRPEVKVITGQIKANILTRVALKVSSGYDSQTIIDSNGAESLLFHGDMLVLTPSMSRNFMPRVQSPLVLDFELNRICDYLRTTYGPIYDETYLNLKPQETNYQQDNPNSNNIDSKRVEDEELYKMIVENTKGKEYQSQSTITNTFGIGFHRAGRMLLRLQNEGYIDKTYEPGRGNKVLIKFTQSSSDSISCDSTEIVKHFDPNKY